MHVLSYSLTAPCDKVKRAANDVTNGIEGPRVGIEAMEM